MQETSFRAEVMALFKLLSRKDILLLLPVFWAAYFNQFTGSKLKLSMTGLIPDFSTYYFGLRARCLIGFLTNFSAIGSSFMISALLDYGKWPVKKRLNVA